MDCCKYCGHDEFYTKDYHYGSVYWRHRFDGDSANNSEALDHVLCKQGKIAFCSNCDKRLGRVEIAFDKIIWL